MSPNENNLLIDHLDNILQGKEARGLEELIRDNEELAQEWKALQFTAANIYEAGLHAQVRAVRDQYAAIGGRSHYQATGGAVVRTMTQKMMRVAAVLVFVTFSAVVYKYISVNESSVYNKYYSGYELNTSRSQANDNELETAYRNQNWSNVIAIVNGLQTKTSKHFFLAGLSYLELEQYNQAVSSFQSVINTNKASGDDYFGDEAEYYLAMSYLANRKGETALPLLEKIRKDKNHMYNHVVSKMGMDYKILRIKERN